NSIRTGIIKRLDMIYRGIGSRFLPALLLGERGLLYDDEYNAVYANNLVHIISVSGMHVGFLMLLILFLFNFRRNIFFFVVTIFLTWIYAALTGFSPSCVRAVIIVNIACMTSKKVDRLYLMMLTAFIMLLIKPVLIFNIGFQFSFTSTCGIIYFFSWASDKLDFIPRKLRNIIIISVSAYISLAPLLVLYFKVFSPLSLIVNMIVVPFVSIMMGLGLITFTVSYFSIWLACILSMANEFLMNNIFFILKSTAQLKYMTFKVQNIGIWTVIGLYVCLIIIPKLEQIRENERGIRLLTIGTIIILLFSCMSFMN
ncbi:ComEC/Rec2 family competence protein, partial [bacterium]